MRVCCTACWTILKCSLVHEHQCWFCKCWNMPLWPNSCALKSSIDIIHNCNSKTNQHHISHVIINRPGIIKPSAICFASTFVTFTSLSLPSCSSSRSSSKLKRWLKQKPKRMQHQHSILFQTNVMVMICLVFELDVVIVCQGQYKNRYSSTIQYHHRVH